MSLAILGMGTAVPPERYTLDESIAAARAMAAADEDRTAILHELYEQTEIRTRHMALDRGHYDDIIGASDLQTGYRPKGPDDRGPSTAERMADYRREALPLALLATRRALEDARVAPSAITHLVTVSCTGFEAPGFDIGLIKGLELPPTVERTHVGFMGCHGAFNGLRVARAYTGADPGARVLLCSLELCSVHVYYTWNPKRLVGNALFADGAGALVGAPPAAAPDGAWRAAANGSRLFPDSEKAMTWAIGNHGFEMNLSAKVPNLIADHLRPWLTEWLRGHGLGIADVGSWAVHPGGPRIVTAVESALGLDRRQTAVSREVLGRFGNMSSATILFILQRLLKENARRPVVALGFGPGLVGEAALLR